MRNHKRMAGGAIEELMKYEVAGDPVSGLRWTRKTTKKIPAELSALGIRVSRKTVAGTCQQLWDTRELHLVSLDYGGETREVGAIDVNIDQDLVA